MGGSEDLSRGCQGAPGSPPVSCSGAGSPWRSDSLNSILAAWLAAFALLAGTTLPVLAEDLKGHGGPVKAVAVSADGTRALSGSFDYAMIFWVLDGDRSELLKRFIGHDAAVNAVEFTPDGKHAVSGSDDGSIAIWDLETHKQVHRFTGHKAKVVDLAVSPDGHYVASAGWDRTVRLWNIKEMKAGPVLEGHTNNVNAVAFSPDGATLYSGGYDGQVWMWKVAEGKRLRPVIRFGWGVNVLHALADGKHLVFGSLSGAVNVLDIESGDIAKELEVHEGPVLSAALSTTHGLFATGGGDGRIRVWSTENWKVKYAHDNPLGPVWSLAFAGDGRSLFYSGLDDFAIHWQMDPAKPFEPAKGKFPRRFQVTGDVDPGERQFARKCSVCHTLTPDDANRAGPTLYGLFGRRAGTVPGYTYSDALDGSDIVWNEKTIGELFSQGPEHYTPGTKMPLQRIKNPDDRKALIAYLKRATGPASQ